MEFVHKSVLLNECIENLNIKPNGIYVDATLGGAGHSSEIAKRLSSEGLLIGIDKDIEALNTSKDRLKNFNCKKIFVNDDCFRMDTFISFSLFCRVIGTFNVVTCCVRVL